MKFSKHILFFFIAGVLSFSCDSELTSPTAGSQILPLAIGNKWNYQSYWVNNHIIVSDTFFTQMSITSLDTVKSYIGYRLRNFLFWDWRSTYCSNKSDGLHIAIDPDENAPIPPPPPPPPRPLIIGKGLSSPTYVGDSWNFDTYQIRTAKLNQSISVPAGVFNCINYEIFEADTLIAELWVTPAIGIIKGLQKYASGEIKVNMLISYEVDK